jgi:RND superfamily putative drug exporter
VPALMQLFGRANWWIPNWLDRRLPRFDVDASPIATEKA